MAKSNSKFCFLNSTLKSRIGQDIPPAKLPESSKINGLDKPTKNLSMSVFFFFFENLMC